LYIESSGSRRYSGKLFQMVGPATVKIWTQTKWVNISEKFMYTCTYHVCVCSLWSSCHRSQSSSVGLFIKFQNRQRHRCRERFVSL